MHTNGHHMTEFLPAPVEPATSVWLPARETCQSCPYSVRPDHTRRTSTSLSSIARQATASASRLRR
jgi:hypothetical protein